MLSCLMNSRKLRNIFVKFLNLVFIPLYLFFLIILYCIEPFVKVRIGCLRTDRLGHLSFNSELFLRRQKLGIVPLYTFSIFYCGPPANQQLLKMIRRKLQIIEVSDFTLLVLNRFIPHFSKTIFFQETPMNSNEYYEFNNASPCLDFTEKEEKQGKQQLERMGIDPDENWFVCVSSRDSMYMDRDFPGQDWSYHDHRNADINSFIPAIKYIIEVGGVVLRMGSVTNKKVNFTHENLIDYSNKYRNDFMDVYLSAKCKFVLGTTGGISDLPVIFDVPRVATNFVPFSHVPWGKQSIYIPKKVKKKSSGEYESFAFMLKNYDREMNGNSIQEADYEYEDNTEGEILELVVEMMQKLDGTFEVSDIECDLMEQYYDLFTEDKWSHGVKNPIGMKFLIRNHKLFFDKVG
jgi:putative glycosyltransferase (TIGR04372 family)